MKKLRVMVEEGASIVKGKKYKNIRVYDMSLKEMLDSMGNASNPDLSSQQVAVLTHMDEMIPKKKLNEFRKCMLGVLEMERELVIREEQP